MLGGPAGFGHPFAGAVPAENLEFKPAAQVVRDERPEVMKRSRGVGDASSSGMKSVVMTCVDVTLTEYAWFQAERSAVVLGSDSIWMSKAAPAYVNIDRLMNQSTTLRLILRHMGGE
jgi:hypothetical protein